MEMKELDKKELEKVTGGEQPVTYTVGGVRFRCNVPDCGGEIDTGWDVDWPMYYCCPKCGKRYQVNLPEWEVWDDQHEGVEIIEWYGSH